MKQNTLARVTVRRVTSTLRKPASVAHYRVEELIGRGDLPIKKDVKPNALVGDIVTQEDVDNLFENWSDIISTRVLAPKE